MAYIRIETGRYHPLLFFNLDHARGKAVLLENNKNDRERNRDQSIARKNQQKRHRRPPEAMVESRDDQQRAKEGARDPLNDFLGGFRLGNRTGGRPARDEIWVV